MQSSRPCNPLLESEISCSPEGCSSGSRSSDSSLGPRSALPFPLGCTSDDEGSPGPSSFESSSSSQGFVGLRCVTPPTDQVDPRKLSPFKKKNKPVLPSLTTVVDTASPVCNSTGVNPFESGRMRKARSCETFLQEQDEEELARAVTDVQTPIVECAPDGAPTRSILRTKSKCSIVGKKRSAWWAPDVRSPVPRSVSIAC
eukprot:Hpha_TRINITY_DN14071_c0_g1::TRINITY_DN14071_c0_g1_i1::g.43931::m.43931